MKSLELLSYPSSCNNLYSFLLTNLKNSAMMLMGENKIMALFKNIWFAFVAITRLLLLNLIMFLNGIHQIIFNSSEVTNVSLLIRPNTLARDKLSYIDNLRLANMDLAQKDPASLPADAFDDSKFKTDEEYLEDDLLDDFEDGEDDDNNENPRL